MAVLSCCTDGELCSCERNFSGDANVAPEVSAIRAVPKQQCQDESLDSVFENEGVRDSIDKRALKSISDAFVLSNVLSPTECQNLIRRTEASGYSFWNENEARRDFRNADTVEVTHKPFADVLWDRMRPFVVPVVTVTEDEDRCERGMGGTWEAFAVNPHQLFARYEEGGHFSPHTDGYTVEDFNTRSLYTCILYLNDCKEGGGTRLLTSVEARDKDYIRDAGGRFRCGEDRVSDRAGCDEGSALVFFQDVPHEGEPVGPGCCKYIIRTDIMYRRTPPICDGPADHAAYAMLREAEILEEDGKLDEATALFRRIRRTSPALALLLGL